MQYLDIIISVTRFRCITCDKAIKCDHQDKKDVKDHIDMPNHKSRAAVRKKRTQSIFPSVSNDTMLQKLTFAELRMAVLSATQNIPSSFHDILSTTIRKIFPDSQIALKYQGDSTKYTCILNGALTPFNLEDLTSTMKHQLFLISIDSSNDAGLEK